MKLVFTILFSTIYSLSALAGTTETSAMSIKEVKVYAECALIRLDDPSVPNRAYLFPIETSNGTAKLSIALSAFHSGSDVKIKYWGTSTCKSVDDHLLEGEETPSKYFVYSISTIK